MRAFFGRLRDIAEISLPDKSDTCFMVLHNFESVLYVHVSIYSNPVFATYI